MTEPAQKEPTAEELAELREYAPLLPLLRALKRQLLAQLSKPNEVDLPARPGVRAAKPDPTEAEIMADVLERRRRRGHGS